MIFARVVLALWVAVTFWACMSLVMEHIFTPEKVPREDPVFWKALVMCLLWPVFLFSASARSYLWRIIRGVNT